MEPSLTLLIPTVMTVALFSFAIGLDARWDAFRELVLRPRPVLVGLFGQYLMLPLIAVAIVLIVKPPVEIGLGIFILASAPGGVLSNGIVYLMRGDFVLSVTLTTISSIASPISMATILVAATAFAYGASENVTVPMAQTMATLFVLVFIPIALGYTVYRIWPASVAGIHKWVDPAATIGLVFSVVMSLYSSREVLAASLADSLVPGILLVGLGLMGAMAIACAARLSLRQTLSITFEVGFQNIAMAIVIAAQVMGRPELAIFPLVYGSASLAVFVPLALLIRQMKIGASLEPARQDAAPAIPKTPRRGGRH